MKWPSNIGKHKYNSFNFWTKIQSDSLISEVSSRKELLFQPYQVSIETVKPCTYMVSQYGCFFNKFFFAIFELFSFKISIPKVLFFSFFLIIKPDYARLKLTPTRYFKNLDDNAKTIAKNSRDLLLISCVNSYVSHMCKMTQYCDTGWWRCPIPCHFPFHTRNEHLCVCVCVRQCPYPKLKCMHVCLCVIWAYALLLLCLL